MRHQKVILFALTICGAAVLTTRRSAPPDAAPGITQPRSDVEALIAQAIRRAVIDEEDIPDYPLLEGEQRIVISSVIGPAADAGRAPSRPIDSVATHALPKDEAVTFVLLTPEATQQRADALNDDFLYLQVGDVDVSGTRAFVELNSRWATPPDSENVYLSGGGYRLEYVKRDGAWPFEHVERAWIS